MKKIFIFIIISFAYIQISFAHDKWSASIVVEPKSTDYIETKDRVVPNDWHSQESLLPQNVPDNKGILPKGYYYPQVEEITYFQREYPVWQKFVPTQDLPSPIDNHGYLIHGYNLYHDVHTFDHSEVQILEDGTRINLKDTCANPTRP